MVHTVQYYGNEPKKQKIGRETFMKKLLALAGVGGLAYVLLTNDAVKEKLFNGKYEDQILKLIDLGYLASDVLMWPVHYVKAILP